MVDSDVLNRARDLRSREMKLLVMASGYLAAGTGAVGLWGRGDPGQLVLGAGGCILAFLAVGLFFYIGGFVFDPFLLPPVAVLTFTGLVFLYRLQPAYAIRQLVWTGAGLVFLLLITRFLPNLRLLSDYKYLYALAGFTALVLPIFFGIEQGGSKSWLNFKLFQVQPSEFVKILVVMFLASYMAEKSFALRRGTRTVMGLSLPGPGDLGPLLGMWGVSLLLLVFQRDLGTALIYFGTFLAMFYVATARVSYIITGIMLFLAGAGASYKMFGHVRQRVQIWLLRPEDFGVLGKNMYDQAYQVIQSLFAIGAGGLTGAGLGAGYPKFIPAVHTDFIFAAITEEMGLLGGCGIIILYLIIIYRGFKIAMAARDDFSILLAAGLTSLLGLQAFIIMAGVTKLMPLTGVTLPFVSYGGSSLLANFIILGILMNISHEANSHEK